MSAFLITWRPAGEVKGRGWAESNIQRLVDRLVKSGAVRESWPFSAYRMAKKGDRVFLVRQGRRGHALFGYGRIVTIPNPYKGSVVVSFEALYVPSASVLATQGDLHRITSARKVWGTRASGIPLSENVAAALERLGGGRWPLPSGLGEGPSSRKPKKPTADALEDSIDDLAGIDYGALGSDGAGRIRTVISGVRRDPRVRRAVLKRSNGRCERDDCRIRKNYSGFLDVHHILGAEKSDRVWNCVAICPNCHREAHASPKQEQINARLLAFASRFKP